MLTYSPLDRPHMAFSGMRLQATLSRCLPAPNIARALRLIRTRRRGKATPSNRAVAPGHLEGAVVGRRQHASRIARHDHVDHGRARRVGEARAQGYRELVGMLDADAEAPETLGDLGIVQLDEVGRL